MEGCRLIVVGSRGNSRAKRFFMGSVSHSLAHHAPCDVLIVRARGFTYTAPDANYKSVVVATGRIPDADRAARKGSISRGRSAQRRPSCSSDIRAAATRS